MTKPRRIPTTSNLGGHESRASLHILAPSVPLATSLWFREATRQRGIYSAHDVNQPPRLPREPDLPGDSPARGHRGLDHVRVRAPGDEEGRGRHDAGADFEDL